jgi:hypothetical protein
MEQGAVRALKVGVLDQDQAGFGGTPAVVASGDGDEETGHQGPP